MKTKLFTLLAVLLCVAVFSSCSKDDEVNLPPLTTQDLISMCGLTESDLDAKMSGYKKNVTESGITYSNVNEIYVSAYESDDNFLSVVIDGGIAMQVTLLHKKHIYSFFDTVESDLIGMYPNIEDISSVYGNSLIVFKSGGNKITLFKSSERDTAHLQIEQLN